MTGTGTMINNNTNITIDTSKDPFKDYGQSINNFVCYTSFNDEEKKNGEKEKG